MSSPELGKNLIHDTGIVNTDKVFVTVFYNDLKNDYLRVIYWLILWNKKDIFFSAITKAVKVLEQYLIAVFIIKCDSIPRLGRIVCQ